MATDILLQLQFRTGCKDQKEFLQQHLSKNIGKWWGWMGKQKTQGEKERKQENETEK